MVALTRMWSAMTAETRVGYQDTTSDRLDGRYTQGIPGLGGAIGFSTGDGEIISTPGRVASVEQIVTTQRGRHLLKLGGIWARSTTGRANIEQPIFTYSSVDDFLANIPSAVRLTFGVAPFEIRFSQWGGFVQDDIRLTSRLIASLGLRYDYFTVPEERDGRFFNRDAPTGFGPLRSADSIYQGDSNGFAPRISVAWSLDSDSRTVIRGGAGKFIAARSILGGIVDLVQTALDEPFRVTLTRAEALSLGVRYPISNEEALRLVRGAPAQWTGAGLSADLPNPNSVQWLAGLERRLTSSIAVEASYVGNRAENLNFARVMGLPDRQTGVRPVPGFGTFRYIDASGSSTYHSLQLNLRKAFSGSLAASAHYTWSRNRSYGDANTGITLASQDANDREAEYGPTPYDVPHAFAADWIYHVPAPRTDSALARAVLGGWQVSSVLRAQSGFPLNVTQSTSYPSSRPDLVRDDVVLPDWRRTLLYLDRGAFAAVPIISESGAASRPGTLTRHGVRGPGFWTMDLAIAKNVTLPAAQRAQVRLDAFNLLNRPLYTSVVTNINSSQFGRLTAATGRTVQLNLRYTF
jgi:outer membrane receptor protein involved in Fe transport